VNKYSLPLIFGCTLVFAFGARADGTDAGIDTPWPKEKAWQWYRAQPWLCGFNYVPANDVSYTEMWMDGGFDAKQIDRELALAPQTGFNCLRVVLSYVDWKGDRTGFLRRFDDFLAICDRHQLRAIVCFFDDCSFGLITDPVFGPQPAMVPGWYGNGWTPSPGHKTVVDRSAFPDLQRYVQEVMQAHKSDSRVLCWDLYNEAGNAGMGEKSLPLLEACFHWAREVAPVQPITSRDYGARNAITPFVDTHSDIITLHCYAKPDRLRQRLAEVAQPGRPVICTEWMNRNTGSTVADCLPVFAAQDVGCLNWGLVNGKTQTNLNWGHRPGQPDPPKWQHDLYHGDFTPYDPAELQLFRETIARMRATPPAGSPR
jgi:hypothetical protein